MKRFLSIASLLLLLAGSVHAQSPGTPAPSATPKFPDRAVPFPTPSPDEAKKLAAMPVEDLISMLQEESKPGMGVDPTDPVYRMDLGADYHDFQGGEFPGDKTMVSPVMHELITRGPAALPALIAHLTDERTTKYTVGEGFTDVLIASGYDAEDRRPDKQQPGISDSPYKMDLYGKVKSYNVTVGDFCYAAIGQIVNRYLNAVQYQAPLLVVVNTPSYVPALAKAVKHDWGDIKPDDLRKSLEEDAGRYSDAQALKRLYLYFPDSADATAVKLLKRPLYTWQPMQDFVSKTLLQAGSDEERDKLLADYKAKNPEINYQGVLKQLVWISTTIRIPADAPDKIAANGLLSRLSPKIEPFNPPIFDSATYAQQQELIGNLGPIRSKAVDDAVAELLQRISGMKEVQVDLAVVCGQRLLGKPEYEQAIRASFEKMIATQSKHAEQESMVFFGGGRDPWGIQRLKAILDKLPAKKDAGAK